MATLKSEIDPADVGFDPGRLGVLDRHFQPVDGDVALWGQHYAVPPAGSTTCPPIRDSSPATGEPAAEPLLLALFRSGYGNGAAPEGWRVRTATRALCW